MRKLAAAVCIFASAFAQQPKFWHEQSPISYGPWASGWQLALFSEKQGFFVGEPVLVMLTAQNTTSKRLKVGLHKSEWQKAEFVVTRLGNPTTLKLRVAANEFERLRRAAGGTMLVDAQPGELVHPGLVNLQDLFDLSPGTYTITAACKLTDKDTGRSVAVPSNRITISIVQRP